VPASRAALIYLLEPVFAAVLSIVIGHDSVTGRLVLGGAIIICGNALVELPLWIRSYRARRRQGQRGAEAPTEPYLNYSRRPEQAD
jgi:drug/metabolite transporter (DMT)-like permease